MNQALAIVLLIGVIAALIVALARLALHAGRVEARAQEAIKQRESIEDLARRSQGIEDELQGMSDEELRRRITDL